MNTNALRRAFRFLSVRAIATACGVSPAAAHAWKSRGKLPRTEHTRETDYATIISKLTRRRVSVRALRDAGYHDEEN